MVLPTYVVKDNITQTRSIVADNAGNFYFSSVSTNTIYKLDPAGSITTFFSSGAVINGTLAIDSTSTYLYSVRQDVATNVTSIYKYDLSTTTPPSLVIDDLGLADAEVPMCIDSTGNIFYRDSTGAKIMKYDTVNSEGGVFTTLTGSITIFNSIAISSNGSFIYITYNGAAGFQLAKINASTGDLMDQDFASGSGDTTNSTLLTNTSGIFLITIDSVLKYPSNGGSASTPYIAPADFPTNVYSAGTFDKAGRYLYVVKYDGTTTSHQLITTRAPPVLCFKEGSKILCLQGEKEEYLEIQDLRKDMLVKTVGSGYKKVDMIGTSVLYNDHSNNNCLDNLYICKKEDYPELTEDLVITGSHAILVDTLTEKQREMIIKYFGKIYVTDNKYRLAACFDPRTKPYDVKEEVNIWHLSLEHTNKVMNYGIYANGLLVESASKRMMGEISGMKLL